MNLLKKLFLLIFITFSFTSLVNAASNPYGKYQSLYGITTVRCTWYAWQEAYEHTGVALPGWGNAQMWYNIKHFMAYFSQKKCAIKLLYLISSKKSFIREK